MRNVYIGLKHTFNPSKKDISAAMDVIVIENADGSLGSTPFFIHFGMFHLLDSNNQLVDVYCNGKPTGLKMILDGNGVAKFKRENVLEAELLRVATMPVTHHQNSSSLECSPEKKEGMKNQLSLSNEDKKLLEEIAKEEEDNESDSSEENKLSFSSSDEKDENENPEEQNQSKAEDLSQIEVVNKSTEEDQSQNRHFQTTPSESTLKPTRISYFATDPSTEFDRILITDELKMLELNPGLNIAHFVIRSNPKVYMPCKIYLWKSDSKIIISDIDGTLTKSDLLGHIFYYLGKDWTRGSAVYFFNLLMERGYHIIYLTARSLSQIESTRTYLNTIKQDEKRLPDGPLMMNPSGVLKALASELAKKSKEFKEKILNEIKFLFPEGYFPFYSGIGNRSGDADAYAAVGIPRDRIFIINKKGKEKGDFISINNFKDSRLPIESLFQNLN
ncbi:hypothetical protein SteCoe_21108 [Stentor coeruleus]|uniref:LNS2/PITP domain-containing protein n=1 Tax=Stentor coeruleus TaxID=5963 RepID=A0A1R2BQJ6_9CILI|nr:hypothetical protein SteCoe_21108 [Stentor coeruleus]